MTGYPDCQIDERATVGYEHESGATHPEIGAGATIRAGDIIYCNVTIGASSRLVTPSWYARRRTISGRDTNE